MESKTSTYTVLYAEDIPHYGTVEIEAPNDEAAIEAARAFDGSTVTDDPDWSSIVCRRIVSIAAPDGRIIAHDIPLDNCFLRYGVDEDRRLCDAAPKLLAALKRIAATPLWGESIPPGDVRDDYVFAGEWS